MSPRRFLAPLAVLSASAVLLVGAAVLASPDQDVAQGPSGGAVAAGQTGQGFLAEQITSLRARTDRLPGDYQAWATLGLAYVQQGAATADPSNYALAEQAFGRSLQVRAEDNDLALTGQASLAAARHDFSEALALTEQAEAINGFSSTNFGIKGDALIELGRYEDAYDAFQRMNDLRPGVPAFTRASYALELQGEIDASRAALEQAVTIATAPADKAFAQFYLGELAWKTGDLDAASAAYEASLQQDPAYVAAIGGQAKVAAARGDTDAALELYSQLTRRLPLAAHLVQYADLLRALGRDDEALEQEALLDSVDALFEAQGVNVDLEQSLYLADRGRAAEALEAAEAEYAKRQSILVEDALGWALHVSGRSAEALVHAQAAVRLGNPDAPLYYHKGMIEKALGMDAEARASLTRALELNPEFNPLQAPVAKAALAELGPA